MKNIHCALFMAPTSVMIGEDGMSNIQCRLSEQPRDKKTIPHMDIRRRRDQHLELCDDERFFQRQAKIS